MRSSDRKLLDFIQKYAADSLTQSELGIYKQQLESRLESGKVPKADIPKFHAALGAVKIAMDRGQSGSGLIPKGEQ